MTGTNTVAVATPTDTDRQECERRGNALIALLSHDAQTTLVSKIVHYAERAAGRNSEYGDIVADTVSLALSLFAIEIGTNGLPTDTEHRAMLVSVTAKRAAQSAKDKARREWAPRNKANATTDTETVPAPNALGSWKEGSLIRRAERYTNGKLSTRTQAAAVIDARDESSLLRIVHGPTVHRTNGGTSPAAESTYWRTRHTDVLATCLESSFALSGINRDALTGTDVWSRTNGIHWQTLGTAAGRDRGTIRREVRRAAAIARRVAHSLPLAIGAPIPAGIDSPSTPTYIVGTLPPVPAPNAYPNSAFLRSVPSRFITRGDDTFAGTADPDSPMAFGAAAFVVDRDGRTEHAWTVRLSDDVTAWGRYVLARSARAAIAAAR